MINMTSGSYAAYPSLKGKTVFISGGSSGIGAELVRAFGAQGSRVAFCGTKAGGGDALVAELAQAGLGGVGRSRRDRQVVVAPDLGGVVGPPVLAGDALPKRLGDLERAHLIGYTTSKAAISGMTRTLARELGDAGIRVNALVPGAIVTERQTTLWRNPEEDQKFIDLQCLKFRLESVHVARPTLFLASDDSDGITGQNLIVDAGLAQVSVAG